MLNLKNIALFRKDWFWKKDQRIFKYNLQKCYELTILHKMVYSTIFVGKFKTRMGKYIFFKLHFQ